MKVSPYIYSKLYQFIFILKILMRKLLMIGYQLW